MFVKGQQQQVEQIRNPQSALFTNTSSTVTVSGITARAVSNSSSLIYTSEATTILTTETLLEVTEKFYFILFYFIFRPQLFDLITAYTPIVRLP